MQWAPEDLAKSCDEALAAASKARSLEMRVAHLTTALRCAQAAYRGRLATHEHRPTVTSAIAEQAFAGPPTPNYKVHCLDTSGHVTSTEQIQARNDEEAVLTARSRMYGSTCEVWDGVRLVAKIVDYSDAQ